MTIKPPPAWLFYFVGFSNLTLATMASTNNQLVGSLLVGLACVYLGIRSEDRKTGNP